MRMNCILADLTVCLLVYAICMLTISAKLLWLLQVPATVPLLHLLPPTPKSRDQEHLNFESGITTALHTATKIPLMHKSSYTAQSYITSVKRRRIITFLTLPWPF